MPLNLMNAGTGREIGPGRALLQSSGGERCQDQEAEARRATPQFGQGNIFVNPYALFFSFYILFQGNGDNFLFLFILLFFF